MFSPLRLLTPAGTSRLNGVTYCSQALAVSGVRRCAGPLVSPEPYCQ